MATTTYNYNSATLQLQHLQLQLQLHYTTLHPAVVGEVTTANIATTPKKHNSNHLPAISGFALPSVIHNNQPLLGFLFLKLPPRPCAVLLVSYALLCYVIFCDVMLC